MRILFLLGLILGLLSACEAQATPVAVAPQLTVTPQEAAATAAPSIRYGIAANSADYIADLNRLRQGALVEVIPLDSDLTAFDLVAAFGVPQGWQTAPVAHTFALVINPNLAPMDDRAIAELVYKSLNTVALASATGITGANPASNEHIAAVGIRTELANAGFPDGFRLTLATTANHMGEELLGQLRAANFDPLVNTIALDEALETLEDNRAHLLVVRWTDDNARQEWVERVGADHVVDLYQLPIGYIANEGISIRFTEDGWPLPSRPSS